VFYSTFLRWFLMYFVLVSNNKTINAFQTSWNFNFWNSALIYEFWKIITIIIVIVKLMIMIILIWNRSQTYHKLKCQLVNVFPLRTHPLLTLTFTRNLILIVLCTCLQATLTHTCAQLSQGNWVLSHWSFT